MEAPRIGTVTLELRLDWDRIGVLFASFGIACGPIDTNACWALVDTPITLLARAPMS